MPHVPGRSRKGRLLRGLTRIKRHGRYFDTHTAEGEAARLPQVEPPPVCDYMLTPCRRNCAPGACELRRGGDDNGARER